MYIPGMLTPYLKLLVISLCLQNRCHRCCLVDTDLCRSLLDVSATCECLNVGCISCRSLCASAGAALACSWACQRSCALHSELPGSIRCLRPLLAVAMHCCFLPPFLGTEKP